MWYYRSMKLLNYFSAIYHVHPPVARHSAWFATVFIQRLPAIQPLPATPELEAITFHLLPLLRDKGTGHRPLQLYAPQLDSRRLSLSSYQFSIHCLLPLTLRPLLSTFCHYRGIKAPVIGLSNCTSLSLILRSSHLAPTCHPTIACHHWACGHYSPRSAIYSSAGHRLLQLYAPQLDFRQLLLSGYQL